MGFGSYDESEQDNQELGDIEDDDGVTTEENEHDGDIEYEIGASSDELINRLQDIKEDDAG
ncbi:death domain-associated protein [Halobacteriales archaeon QS_9_68_17]|nr:MAG: death domain-associated protein [Halobacteriales archaeon QS_9_68_17]